MPTPIFISGLQNRVKNCYTFAPELGLMLVSNGEETPYLLNQNGEQITAGILAPEKTNVPTVADNSSGNLPNGDYVVYAFTYAAINSFPLVAADIESNPSPFSLPYNITGSGNRKLTITLVGTSDPLVTDVYLYRTEPQTTSALALVAAQAGLLNFVGSVTNATGSLTIDDNLATAVGNQSIELANFTVPQFRFSVWDGSYFWCFGNQPFSAQATWAMDGSFTLNNPDVDQFYGGRNGQFVTFDQVNIGGIDNKGTFLFKQTGAFTGQAILTDGSDATIPNSMSGNVTIVGATADLYRSGYRNPFVWGYLQNIAGIFVPNLWDLKISGGIGTAIAIIPDQQLLKLDMEYPALCVTYSLQTSSTDVFATTQRQVSRLYSATSHFSQFFAVAGGRQVLWSMDFKNLAIIQCDGYVQVPISSPVSILLRQLSKNRSLQLSCHGLYDPTTEINAIWLSSIAVDEGKVPTNFDLCIYQHAPTGYWGIISDYGILSSAVVEDPVTSKRSTIVGTENGFIGTAFDESTYGNWLPTNSLLSGQICAGTTTSITRSDGQDDFNPLDGGLIGNYCILVDNKGLNPQIALISAATFNTLSFSSPVEIVPTTTQDPGLVAGQWKFFIGLIELRMLKYFNVGEPSIDKAPREYWATLEDANLAQVEFYPEHTSVPIAAEILNQDLIPTSKIGLDAWFQKMKFPTAKQKSFGLALVERSYQPTKFYDFTLTT